MEEWDNKPKAEEKILERNERYLDIERRFLQLISDQELLGPIKLEQTSIFQKQEKKLSPKWRPGREIIESMPTDVLTRYKTLEYQVEQYEKRWYELYLELLDLVSRDLSLVWTKQEYVGGEKDLARNHSQDYLTNLGKEFSIQISWADYPSIYEANNRDAYKDRYYIKLRDKNGDIDMRIPGYEVGIEETESGEFQSSRSRLEEILSRDDFEEIKQDLLLIGRRLQDELGYPKSE